MSIVLFHHPFSRAAGTVWQLEEVGVEHELRFVDILAGEQKSPEILAMNPMGKLPILKDGDVVVTEGAAIGMYLADRYAPGRLAPAIDDPARGTYLRWICFAPAVIEPAVIAKVGGWEYKPSQAGWGVYDAVLDSMERALEGREYVLGDRFSMADVIFGGTLRYMMQFGTIEARPTFVAYAERLAARPALKRADERNAAIVTERGLKS
jgi:glutathione S-transferase